MRQFVITILLLILVFLPPLEVNAFTIMEEPSDSWDVSGNYSINWYNKRILKILRNLLFSYESIYIDYFILC